MSEGEALIQPGTLVSVDGVTYKAVARDLGDLNLHVCEGCVASREFDPENDYLIRLCGKLPDCSGDAKGDQAVVFVETTEE